MSNFLGLLGIVLPVLGAIPGYTSCRQEACVAAGVENPPRLVIIADGGGDFRKTSASISTVVAQDQIPLQVETFVWSHGYCRVFSDQVDKAHIQAQGHRLAQVIAAHRRDCPGMAITLVGHCAGCAVILAAAERLSPDMVERIILLAPSVAAGYDLRGALRNSRLGIDVFWSHDDRWLLGLGMVCINATQCRCYPAAGRKGFYPLVQTAEDVVLYTRLRQYPWDRSLAWTGHKGGHYGSYQPGFLRAFVLPLVVEEGEVKEYSAGGYAAPTTSSPR